MPKRNRAREVRRATAASPAAGAPDDDAGPSGTGTRPPRGVVHLVSPAEARDLAARLLTPGRTWPVVVVSTPAGSAEPYVDVDQLAAEVGDLAEVVVVPTGETSWAFSEAMPPRTQVYGGASRVYQVEDDWVADPYRSRLRFAYSVTDGGQVRDLLVHDALGAAMRAGLVGTGAPQRAAAPVGGRVRGVVGPRAFVDLDDGGQVTVAEELTVPGTPLARVLAAGQRVSGTVDDATRLLDLGAALPDDAASRRLVDGAYRPGDVVLVRVRDAEHDSVTVELAPRYACRVPRERVTGNDLDRLDDLFGPGEVVLARIVPSPGGVAVRLDDVDDHDDVPRTALALLPGGPPWLAPPATPELVATVDAGAGRSAEPVTVPAPPVPAPAEAHPSQVATPALFAHRARGEHPPMPRPGTPPGEEPLATTTPDPAALEASVRSAKSRALLDTQLAHATAMTRAVRAEERAAAAEARADQLARDVQHLLGDVQHLRGEVERLENRLHDQRAKYRNADRKRQALQRGDAGPVEHGPWFTDPEQQFRHDVYDAWVRTVSPGEKEQLPLGTYAVGPRFLASLELDGLSRRKVAETVVHVVTGRAGDVNGLQLHPLRTSESGNAPQRSRDDGATCWRVSLQVNAPSARRLHYWRLPDGSFELSRAVLHDDMDP